MKTSLLIVVALLLVTPWTTYAASLQITELEDVNFGNVVPDARNVRAQIRFCVVSDPAGPFQITAIGSGAGGRFEMNHPALPNVIDYDVYIQRIFGLFRRQLQPGIPNTVFYARPRLRNGRCAPPYIGLLVDINEDALSSAPGGDYASILQLTVAPE
ncbi:MAG: hypothetical protein GKR90_15475 [Pseudomonadales bacterium]|nr:hypothetical protein [Pseudomonadales bacterium]